MPSLKNLAIRGTIWTIIGYGGSQVLRLGGNLILTRLLVPELFGLMALINTFIQGLTLFSDIGIAPNIIRSPRGDDPVFLNTAWTLQVIRGFGLWMGCLIIAFPVAKFYNEPRLLWLIPMVGLTTIMAGFNSTSLATLNRKLHIGKLTLFQFKIQTISLTIMIVWAYFKQTIWALVGGNLISSFVRMVWSHRLETKISNRFTWEGEALQELISFGRWIFISTAMLFLASQADRLILGKLFSLEMLGIYTIALIIANIPRQLVGQIGSRVIFPLVSNYTELPRTILKEKFLSKRRLILGLSGICLSLLVSFGDLIIKTLYDERFEQAAWMLPILALGIWPLVLFQSINPCLLALGKPIYGAVGNLLKFLYMLICLPIAFYTSGNLGAIIAIALNDLVLYAVVAYGIWREQIMTLLQDLTFSLSLIGLIFLLGITRIYLDLGFPIEQILYK